MQHASVATVVVVGVVGLAVDPKPVSLPSQESGELHFGQGVVAERLPVQPVGELVLADTEWGAEPLLVVTAVVHD